MERSDTASGLVRKLGHLGTLENATDMRLRLSLFQRDKYAVAQYAERLLQTAPADRSAGYESTVNAASGWAMFEEGKCEVGLGMMRESVKAQLWQNPWSASQISLIAAALGQYGDVDEGLELLDDVLRLGQSDDVHWWEAEFRRVKGELLLLTTPDDPGSAEDWFVQAIEIAQLQSAKSLELRAAVSLARLWRDTPPRPGARSAR